jgi:hypothetical protein
VIAGQTLKLPHALTVAGGAMDECG